MLDDSSVSLSSFGKAGRVFSIWFATKFVPFNDIVVGAIVSILPVVVVVAVTCWFVVVI